jgi:hypothetical protein|tara:strand:+ start:186 stop:383 length:198 start_codon:yes stop_codon:yes gene_type:complete
MELWILIAYVLGSAATYFLMRKQIAFNITESIIDQLIAQGFLRSKKDKNGETEIVKWYAPDEIGK